LITHSISLLPHQPYTAPRYLHSFPTRRSSDLDHIRRIKKRRYRAKHQKQHGHNKPAAHHHRVFAEDQQHFFVVELVLEILFGHRSEEHTSELQSRENLVCRLLLEKKKNHRTLS